MESKETKIALVGDRESTLCFSSAGIEVFHMGKDFSLRNMLEELSHKGYGIIFITEEVLAANFSLPESYDMIKSYDKHMLPAVIPVPGRKGSFGIGRGSIHRSAVKAAGADIFMDR